jgi:outer membrane protein assembly factor BamB
MLYCFGQENVNVSTYDYKSKNSEYEEKEIQTYIDKLPFDEGEKGYCFIIGLPPVNIIKKIYKKTELNVIILDPDIKRVQEARQYFDQQGIYGKRLQIIPQDLSSLNLPPYIANFIISFNPEENYFSDEKKFINQLVSFLRPYGGIAHLASSDNQYKIIANYIKQTGIQGITIEKEDEFITLKRIGAPEGSSTWTHEEGSPANTSSNMDLAIKPPMGVTWFGGLVDDSIFSKIKLDYTHSRPPHPLVCDGRMFYIIYDELHALDIYNGCPLWKVSLPQSFITKNRLQEHFTGRRNASNNYIATSDILYVFQESSCLLIDPVTGKQIGEITTSVKQKNINGENLLKWHEARVWEDYLLVNVGSYLVSMDRHTGNIQWKVKTQKNRYNFAVGNGKVFAADYWLPNRRKKITEKESKIQAFDIKTGDLLWDMSVTLSKEEDINNIKEYVVHPIDPYLIYSEKQDIIILLNGYHVMGAYTGTGGKQLWRSDDIRIPRGFPPVVLSDKFITRSGESYDLLTGNIIEKKLWGDLRGCNSIIGNQESIFMRDGVPMVYRLDSGFQNLFLSSRSGCTNNLIPGDGVLCVLNFAVGCACNYPVFTSFGSAHMQDMKN